MNQILVLPKVSASKRELKQKIMFLVLTLSLVLM